MINFFRDHFDILKNKIYIYRKPQNISNESQELKIYIELNRTYLSIIVLELHLREDSLNHCIFSSGRRFGGLMRKVFIYLYAVV